MSLILRRVLGLSIALSGIRNARLLESHVGYKDTNDTGRLACDPTMCQVVGARAEDRPAASTNQMGALRDRDSDLRMR
jgi:hypothetical protein